MINIKCIAVVLALLGSTATAQTTVDLSLEDARAIATRALFSGNPQLATDIALAILNQRPDDRAALLVVAAAAPQLGDATAGRKAGARAWSVSETDIEKYEAARLTALAAANEERFTLSTFWLRRALTVVPNEAERTRTLTDARQVQRRNPWSTNLSLSVVPSNNVNGGANQDKSTVGFDLSESAQELVGVRTTLNFRTSYRFQATETNKIVVGLRYQPSRVILEKEGEPDTGSSVLRGTDFASDLTELTLRSTQAVENGVWDAGFAVGSFDFGGDPYYDYERVSLVRVFVPFEDTRVQLSAMREIQDYTSTGIVEVRRSTLNAGLSYRLENGDRISGSLAYLNASSPTDNYIFEEWTLGGSYQWDEPLGPVSVAINASIKQNDYPSYTPLLGSTPGRRQDTTFSLGVNLGFPEMEYAGFVPGLAINASKSDSNIARFERDTFSVGLTLNSAF